jgi:ketosteroid isomerase-like protein
MGFTYGTTRVGARHPATPAASRSVPAPRAAPVERRPCPSTTELLNAFSAAFGQGDVDAIADCYTTPAIVVTDERSVVFGSREEVAGGFAAALTRYWSSGVVPVGYTVEHETALTAALREVTVEWRHRDGTGRVRFRDRYRYLLRREADGGLRIHVAVVLDPGVVAPIGGGGEA